MQNEDTTAAVAAEYLRHGVALVPIPLGSKGPRGAGWNLRENCITDQADAPKLAGMNLGLAHLYSGTCSIDIDHEVQAVPWFASHGIDAAALSRAPDAVRVSSGRPGRGRLTYRLPPGVSWLPTLKPEGSGLELRCATKDGSATVQDVLPPSIHPDTGKPYVWVGDWRRLPVLPDALLHLWRKLSREPRQRAATGALAGDADGQEVVEGGRNDFLTSRAGAMRRAGFDVEAIEPALLSLNAAKCRPPLPDSEVRAIARSVSKYEAPPTLVVDAEAAISRAAALSVVEYETQRKALAEKLGMRASILDEAVVAKRTKEEAPAAAIADVFPVVEPWGEPVDGAALLDAIRSAAAAHLVMADGDAAQAAIALWIAWTYVDDTRDTAPLLGFSSPTPGCGKTTAMTLVSRLAARPLLLSGMTPATLFRLVETYRPTLLIDEADSFATDNEELRGLLNSGHSRDAARVVRVEESGDGKREVRTFSTWSPKAWACIGHMPGTVESRSIIATMQRKPPGVGVARLGRKKFPELQRKCVRWAADHAVAVGAFECEPPGWMGDRDFDSWLPLLAVAHAAGGHWPDTALAAARVMTGAAAATAEASAGVGVELLRDIRDKFGDDDRVHTVELLSRLCADETLRWGEHQHGKAVTARQVAKLLGPFGITPGTIRLRSNETPKGYMRRQFEDAWNRYLPPFGE